LPVRIDGKEPHMTQKPEHPDRERQMAEFSIGRDGLRYHYNGYRYDKWQDAAAYASLMRDRPWQADAGGSFVPGRTHAPATDAEHALMTSLGIRYDGGSYRFRDFRYDGLSDAVNHAKRDPPRHED
jgi:hypothetical protein